VNDRDPQNAVDDFDEDEANASYEDALDDYINRMEDR
jgi:hypothetical protein